MGAGASTIAAGGETSEGVKKAMADVDAASASLEAALLAAVSAGLPGESVFKSVVARATKFAVKSLKLDAEVINVALDDEIIRTHEPADLTKLAPALRHFSVLAEEHSVKQAVDQFKGAEAAYLEKPESEEALEGIRQLHAALKTAYDTAIDTRVQVKDLFQKAAAAVVAGGDAFREIYTSVWKLVNKPNVSEEDDKAGEGVGEYKQAVAEHLTPELLRPRTSMDELQGMKDPTDVVEYMRNAAEVMAPFGEVVCEVVARAEARGDFKVVSKKKPKSLKKLQRIVEKVALRPEKDGLIAAVCDCVRMMVPVRKMAHVARLLRAFCDDEIMQAVAKQVRDDTRHSTLDHTA